MKRVVSVIFLVTICVVAFSAIAADKVVVIPLYSSKPQALAQINLSSSGGSSFVADSMTLTYDVRVGSEKEGVIIFSLLVSESSIGQIHTIDKSNNQDFDAIVDLLSNGVDNFLQLGASLTGWPGGSAIGYPETKSIKGGINGKYDPDFIGSKITHILVHLDNVTFNSPGSDLNGNGIWTDYSYEIRIVIMGYP